MTDDTNAPDPDRGEVLSLMDTLKAMTEMAQLAEEKDAPHE